MKKTDGSRKTPPVDGMSGDVEMAEDSQDQMTEQWSLFSTLSPLGERLLAIQVSHTNKHSYIHTWS